LVAVTLDSARAVLLRARWELRRACTAFVRQSGVAAVGLAVIVVAAAVVQTWAVAQSARATQAHDAVMDAQSQHAARPQLARPQASDAAALRAGLPSSAQVPQIIQQLISVAERERLLLRTGEYKVSMDTLSSTRSYRIRLPITGEPAAIQRFVINALNEQRTLAIESLTMRRDSIAAREVEASVQFLLVTVPRGAAGAT
jgi:hypothetical protein